METMSLVAFASLTGIAAFVVRARAAAPVAAAAVRPFKGAAHAFQGTGLSTSGSTTDSSPRTGAGFATTTDVVLPAGRHLG